MAPAALGPDVVVVAEAVAAALTYPTDLMKAQEVGPASALLDAVAALAAVAAEIQQQARTQVRVLGLVVAAAAVAPAAVAEVDVEIDLALQLRLMQELAPRSELELLWEPVLEELWLEEAPFASRTPFLSPA